MPSRARLAAAVAALVVFATTLAGVTLHWSWMESLDRAVLAPLYRYGSAHPTWVQGWSLLCAVLHPAVFRALAAIWIGYALLCRHYRVAVFLALSVEGSGLLVVLVKALVGRPRPDTALVTEWSSSFPSGHALGAAVAVCALGVLAWDRLRRLRVAVVIAGVAVVACVGLGRVVLNVHHPSDVLAGWALGCLWVLACQPVLTGFRVSATDRTPAAPGTSP